MAEHVIRPIPLVSDRATTLPPDGDALLLSEIGIPIAFNSDMLRRWRLVLHRVSGVCLVSVSVIVLAAAQSHEEVAYRIESKSGRGT
jgi:hypothetical protein